MKTASESSRPRAIDWQLIFFFVIAYALAWILFLYLGTLAQQAGLKDAASLIGKVEAYDFEGLNLTLPNWFVYLLTRIIDFSFSIAGFIMISVTAGRKGLLKLWQRLTKWRMAWYLYLAGLTPLVLYALATLLSGGFASFNFSVRTLGTILFSAQAGLVVSLFLRGAFGEEFGLRGFALPRLQERLSPFWASLIIGVLWAAWHLPVLLGRDVISIVAFILIAIGLSFIFTWLFNSSGGSLIPVLLFHATQNWEEGFETVFPSLLTTDWELFSTLALLILGIIAAVLVWKSKAST